MSWSWYVYSELVPAELAAIETAYDEAIESYLSDHGDQDGDLAQLSIGAPTPTTDGVSPELRERLGRCRSGVSLDYVSSGLAENPLQVSALDFLLERLKPCVIDWGDHAFELGEKARGALKRMKRARLQPAPPRQARRAPTRRAAKAGELRAIALVQLIANARSGDREAAVYLTDLANRCSELARRYLALLAAEGACGDRMAARRLEVSEATLREAVQPLENAGET